MQPIVYSVRPQRLPASASNSAPNAASSLCDRSVKPPRLNSLGSRVIEQARDLLQRTEALTEKYPKVRVRLSSELTGELIHRLLAGELDVAAVLLPEGKAAPPPLRSGTRLRICLTA
jgi:LysR substrate binding domain-containing protein